MPFKCILKWSVSLGKKVLQRIMKKPLCMTVRVELVLHPPPMKEKQCETSVCHQRVANMGGKHTWASFQCWVTWRTLSRCCWIATDISLRSQLALSLRQGELEKLNQSTDNINRWETELEVRFTCLLSAVTGFAENGCRLNSTDMSKSSAPPPPARPIGRSLHAIDTVFICWETDRGNLFYLSLEFLLWKPQATTTMSSLGTYTSSFHSKPQWLTFFCGTEYKRRYK